MPQKRSASTQTRTDLIKKLQRQARTELRLWKTKWAEYLLQKFANTKYLQTINSSPIRSAACLIDSEAFASFPEEFLPNEAHLIPSEDDKIKQLDSSPFQFEELGSALQGMANLHGADEDGVVVEIIKYASKPSKDTLLSFYNQRKFDGYFDDSWHTMILQMLPK